MSQSKSDSFDAYVLAEFVRTDHAHLRALEPNSAQAQELKMLTRDHHRLVRHKTRLINQIEVTLKEYYPRPLEVFADLESKIALDFLTQYPTPRALSESYRRKWNRFAKREHHLGEARCKELWEKLNQPQLGIPDTWSEPRRNCFWCSSLSLRPWLRRWRATARRSKVFSPLCRRLSLSQTLPGGKSGTIVPMLWAELGDAKSRWQSFRHLQAEAGGVPVTKSSGKSHVVLFRYACNKLMRYASYCRSRALHRSERIRIMDLKSKRRSKYDEESGGGFFEGRSAVACHY